MVKDELDTFNVNLRLAEKAGLGVSNPKDMDVLGEDIEAVRQEFELRSRFQKVRAFLIDVFALR